MHPDDAVQTSPPLDPSAPHIVVVDDDEGLRDLLFQFLSDQGWMVSMAHHAQHARQILEAFSVDVMILDVMMPGETGIQLAYDLRKRHTLDPPILMLTAMSESQDRIAGLEAGVDDYLTKPFEPRELVLRIERLMKRSQERKQQEHVARFGAFTLDTGRRKLLHLNAPVLLTDTEMGLLLTLAHHGNQPVSRETLQQLSGGTLTSERSVDVQITRLRKRLESDPSRPVYIQTMRGSGYMLRVDG